MMPKTKQQKPKTSKKSDTSTSTRDEASAHQSLEDEQSSSTKVEVDGVVVENLQDTRYLVEIKLGELTHRLEAYPGGKMRTYYRGRINIKDRVRVEIDPAYNIDIGRIVRKLPPPSFQRSNNNNSK